MASTLSLTRQCAATLRHVSNFTAVCAQRKMSNSTGKEKKSTQLKKMLTSPDLEFIMEAHNGLSAKIVQEADTSKKPITESVSADTSTVTKTLVYYDLETTGLGRYCNIIQISAVNRKTNFGTYVTPMCKISPQASEITGITYDGNMLYYQGNAVSHHHPKKALQNFIEFISDQGECIVLVAHNNWRFDSIVLYNQLMKYHLWKELCKTVVGFADTLPLFKILFPNMENYKQETLIKVLLKETYAAHNAVEDVRTLQRLVTKMGDVDLLLSEKCMYHSSQLELKEVKKRNKR